MVAIKGRGEESAVGPGERVSRRVAVTDPDDVSSPAVCKYRKGRLGLNQDHGIELLQTAQLNSRRDRGNQTGISATTYECMLQG